MKKQIFLWVAAAAVGLGACNTSPTKTSDSQRADATETSDSAATSSSTSTSSASSTMEKNGLKLTAFDTSPKFPDARLTLLQPAAGGTVAGKDVPFKYELANYQLTAQTEGHHDHANSAQGQHIHNIVDNEPYTAHYTTEFAKPIAEGSHVVLSFLSRSYHESLKHKTAYDLRVINVGKSTTGPGAGFDAKGQHLFYSRPKGEYVGNDTKKVMLDFYLVNTELSASGNKVRATINGTSFMIDRWLPHTLEGLPMGENTIKLELLDKNGAVIPGPFNTVERKFTLKAG